MLSTSSRRILSTAVAFDEGYEDEDRSASVSSTLKGSDAANKAGIATLGITGPKVIYKNLSYQELAEHELDKNEGVFSRHGATFAVDTGIFTGRSPKDRWIVRTPGSESEANIDWGPVNLATSPDVFDELLDQAVAHYNSLGECYVFDGFCGASPASRRKVRFVHERAWQQHFVKNMFIRPTSEEELKAFDPDFTVINASSQLNEAWQRHGLNSDVAVAVNIEKKVAVILGTWYGGENKKGIFSLMNYWLPMEGTMSMHCSANVGVGGDVALFFGLSGTGKTTLSADPQRNLIGDDEHGWDEAGVFNLEGGCYAKTIDLSAETEPDIWKAIKRDAMLENVHLEPDGTPDYSNTSKTQNGRVSYPIYHIPNHEPAQMAGHPSNIIFLTCDAFGVLPPVAKLTPGQAMYQFLSGYTAKVAGTERGVTEPEATFSTCFGAAFMTLNPTRYADLLEQKMEAHGCNAYLVNTGWSGGGYGVGGRMSIATTRACIDAILDGSIDASSFDSDPVFGFQMPTSLPKVEPSVLNPRDAWDDKDAYDAQRLKLARMFTDNFTRFTGPGVTDYTPHGPLIR